MNKPVVEQYETPIFDTAAQSIDVLVCSCGCLRGCSEN
jgi:hypothetical protein